MADTAFYLCVAVTLWSREPRIWHENALLLATLLSLEAIRLVLDFAKFGKPASYHSYLAKTWGLIMAIAVVAVFASSRAHALLPVALLLGIACNFEGLAMSLMLPAWRKDVKTLAAARRIRQELNLLIETPSRPPTRRPAVAVISAALLIVLFSPTLALALEPGQAVYIGGSAAIAADTPGTMDTTSSPTLFFRYKKPDGNVGDIGIDYSAIKTAYANNEVRHHLGVAPAIAVGLLAARQRRYFVTLAWTDKEGTPQAAKIEISKRDQDTLMAVIHARMPQPCQRTPSPCARPAPHAM
jgi:hypothetical protein